MKNWSTEEEAYLAKNVGNERQALRTDHHPAENIFNSFLPTRVLKEKEPEF